MKKAIAYVRNLNIENLDENGLGEISSDMDSYSPKEQFEVLLVIFARFLGTIGSEPVERPTELEKFQQRVNEIPSAPDASFSAGLEAIKKEPGLHVTDPVADLALQAGDPSPDLSNLSDIELQRALSDLPVEAEFNETHKATVRAYRARFSKK